MNTKLRKCAYAFGTFLIALGEGSALKKVAKWSAIVFAALILFAIFGGGMEKAAKIERREAAKADGRLAAWEVAAEWVKTKTFTPNLAEVAEFMDDKVSGAEAKYGGFFAWGIVSAYNRAGRPVKYEWSAWVYEGRVSNAAIGDHEYSSRHPEKFLTLE